MKKMPDPIDQTLEQNSASNTPSEQVAAPTRRRLLKKAGLVGIPVATTLASRPVLAWHCRTPSMWGSMVMNPATSLAKQQTHMTGYRDETWTIINWGRNQGRSSLFSGTGPWDYMVNNDANVNLNNATYAYAVKTTAPSTAYVVIQRNASQVPTKYLDLSLFKVSHLCAATGITKPLDVADNTTVQTLLENSYLTFGAHLVVAQLNFKYLQNIASTSYLTDCLGNGQMNLQTVASSGTYTPSNGGTWDRARIIDYLQNNWIVVPYEGYVTWYNQDTTQVGYSSGTNSDGQAYHYFSFPTQVNSK